LHFLANSSDFLNVILEQCKVVQCVDVGNIFQTHIYLQKLASIQQITSPLEFEDGAADAVVAAAAQAPPSSEARPALFNRRFDRPLRRKM